MDYNIACFFKIWVKYDEALYKYLSLSYHFRVIKYCLELGVGKGLINLQSYNINIKHPLVLQRFNKQIGTNRIAPGSHVEHHMKHSFHISLLRIHSSVHLRCLITVTITFDLSKNTLKGLKKYWRRCKNTHSVY